MYGRAAIRALRTGLCNMTTAVALEQDILRELLGLSGVGVGMQSNAGGKWAHDATMDCRHAASGQSRKTKKKTIDIACLTKYQSVIKEMRQYLGTSCAIVH